MSSLKQLGFETVSDVRIGKYLEVRVYEADRARAEGLVSDMCRKLLANPVIEEFSFDLEDAPAAARPPGG